MWELDHEAGGVAWRAWCVRRGRTVALLTYNCRVEDKGAEDAAVAEIVDSVRIEASP